MGRIVLIIVLLTAALSPAEAAVVINEVMRSNRDTIRDEDGDSPDWVELHNAGDAAVDLGGYGLTDNPARPFKWTIPPRVLEPGGFLLIFCSGKERASNAPLPALPSEIPGVRLWLRADGIDTNNFDQIRIDGDGMFVRSWPAQDSGASTNAGTQLNSALQPEWIPNAVNGHPAVRFQSGRHLSLGFARNFHDLNNVTVMSLVRPHALTNRTVFFSTRGMSESGSFHLELDALGRVAVLGSSGWDARTLPSVIAVEQARLATYRRAFRGNQSIHLDGARQSLDTDLPRAFQGNNAEKFLGISFATAVQTAFNGSLAEIAVFDRALTSAERIGLEKYFAARYGLQSDAEQVELHASFKLGAGNGVIRLTAPGGSVADEIALPALTRDVSFGRQADGGEVMRYFSEATPGMPNITEGFEELLSAPAPSIAPGYHDDAIHVEFAAAPGVEIRYTLDGSEPGDGALLYSGPILLESRVGETNGHSMIPTAPGWDPPLGEVFKLNVLRARAFRSNAIPSDIFTGSYVVGTNAGRYTLPVFSIATADENFFDYVTGIYVPGRIYDLLFDPSVPSWARPANYTQRGFAWERPIHIELFEQDGTAAFSARAGVRMHGGATRSFRRKSMRIIFDSDYGDRRELEYGMFPGVDRSGFRNFVLRSGGNDSTITLFRDAFMHSLAAELGIDGQAYRPSIVFLNGEYWGIHNMRERIDKYYIEGRYGIDPAQLDMIESYGFRIEGDTLHFRELQTFLSQHSPADPAAFEEISRRVDIEQCLNYFLAEIYFNNTDWPGNNIRLWRKRTDGYVPDAPPGHDGRWRWLMLDTDFGFGYTGPQAYTNNTLNHALNPGFIMANSVIRWLVQNPGFRTQFINRAADHMNSVFHTNHVLPRLDSMAATLRPEIPEHIARWRAPALPDHWEMHVGIMRTFGIERAAYVRQHFITAFGLSGTAVVSLNASNHFGGDIRVNSILAVPGLEGDPWEGIYFKGVPITVRAEPRPGYEFAGWVELPGHPEEVIINVQSNVTLTARFEAFPAHALSDGSYIMGHWDASAPAGSYPTNMLFFQTAKLDPGLLDEMDSLWTLPYNLTSRSRINGLSAAGFSFINTGNAQEIEGAGFVGAAVLALDATGRENLQVRWTGGTVTPNTRDYGLRLQYRVGGAGPFHDVPDSNSQPMEYRRSEIAGHSTVLGPVALPAGTRNQPRVELRWKYYFIAGDNGPRAQLRVDDILVTSDVIVPRFMQWMAEHFNEAELNDETVSGPGADPDEDGLPNLLEYASGRHPRQADSGSLLTANLHEDENGGRWLKVHYPRRLDDPAMEYVIELSEDLTDWRGAGSEVVPGDPIPINAELELATVLVPIEIPDRACHVRLGVKLNSAL